MKPLFGLVPLILAGCGVNCPDPTVIDGKYAMFANLPDGSVDVQDFPSYTSPANGWTVWTVNWDVVNGQVDLTIDDQPFTAHGVWDPLRCGDFTLSFTGDYVGENGTDHDILKADGDFQSFADRIEGTWNYKETWVNLDGASGTFNTQGHLSGRFVRESLSCPRGPRTG